MNCNDIVSVALEAGNIGLWSYNFNTQALELSPTAKKHLGLQTAVAPSIGSVQGLLTKGFNLFQWQEFIDQLAESPKTEVMQVGTLSEGTWLEISGKTTLVKGVQMASGTLQTSKQDSEISRQFFFLNALANDAHLVSKIGSWIWDPQEQTTYWSKGMYDLLGLTGDKAVANPSPELVYEYVHPEDKERVIAASHQAMVENKPVPIQYRVKKKTGEIIHVIGDGVGVYNLNGEMVRMHGTVRDITELVEVNKQLAESSDALKEKNKELEAFAYLASHDLQAPLRHIGTLLDLWLDDNKRKLTASEKDIFEMVLQSKDRMENLIQSLLQYATVGKGESKKAIEPKALIADVITDLGSVITANQAVVSMKNLPDKIVAMPTGLRQVFQNLISNAIKFQQPTSNPKIEVVGSETKRGFQFIIKDNGIGIPQEKLSDIFGLFSRLNDREKFDGSGIGLAHCHKIITQHGGKIWANSELGVGSSFHILLPKMHIESKYGADAVLTKAS